MLARHSRSPSAIVQHRYITIDRQRFHYFAWSEDGSPVLLVHGTGFNGYVWKPIAQELSRDAHVLALDQRGHGDSAKPVHGYSWEALADDLHQFLTLLQLTDVTAVGHSAGATAIAVCAATHPGRIRRAVLVDPILFPRAADGPMMDNPLAQRARKRRMVWESRTAMFHSYRTRHPFKSWREDVLWAYVEEGTVSRPDGRIELKCPPEIEAQLFENAPHIDAFAILQQLELPVLLVRGEQSEAFSEPIAARALSELPHGQLKTIARTTHFVPMERPEAVERAVRKFMAIR